MAAATSLREKFDQSYIPEPNSGCWLWDGPYNGHGNQARPVLNFAGKTIKAHRASYELHFGSIPVGAIVCHTCDVKGCVNPSHLYAGTGFTNQRDRAARSRHSYVDGERCGRARLKAEQVLDIYRDERPYPQIAKHYDIGITTVYNIKRGFTWSKTTCAALEEAVRIMAAAPDLLTAAIQAEELLRDGGVVPIRGLAWARLKNAITKAEGKL